MRKWRRSNYWPWIAVLAVLLLPSIALIYYIYILPDNILTTDQLALQTIQNQMLHRFWAIIGLTFSVLAALSTVLGVGLYSSMRRRIVAQLDAAIDDKIRVAQSRTLAITFNEHAYSWFLRYEPLLQRVLSVSQPPPSKSEKMECLEFISTARAMLNHAEESYLYLSPDQRKVFLRSATAQRTYVHIKNHILYAYCAKLIVSDSTPNSQLSEDMNSMATELLEMAFDKELALDGFSWWEAVETIVFFKIHIGQRVCRESWVREGKNHLNCLLSGQQFRTYLKPPPMDTVTQIRDEYTASGIL